MQEMPDDDSESAENLDLGEGEKHYKEKPI
jgi:hypothetical protein